LVTMAATHSRVIVESVFVRSQVIVVASMEITAFSLVEVDRLFRGAYCLHHQSDEFIIRL